MKSSRFGLFTLSTVEGIGFTVAFILIVCTSEIGMRWVSDATADVEPIAEPLAADITALADAPPIVGPVTNVPLSDDSSASISREFDLRGPLLRRDDAGLDRRPTPAHSGARYYARADY